VRFIGFIPDAVDGDGSDSPAPGGDDGIPAPIPSPGTPGAEHPSKVICGVGLSICSEYMRNLKGFIACHFSFSLR
jgi:hypothetical protein